MNLLEAMVIVRNLAIQSEALMGIHQKAIRTVNKNIASLERKKAWRDSLSTGVMPDHATNPDHLLNSKSNR